MITYHARTRQVVGQTLGQRLSTLTQRSPDDLSRRNIALSPVPYILYHLQLARPRQFRNGRREFKIIRLTNDWSFDVVVIYDNSYLSLPWHTAPSLAGFQSLLGNRPK